MCTVSWWSDNNGRYEVFANRDELKTRPAAEAPEIREHAGTQYLAPRDPKGGGTWILANEHGIVLTLLNAYEIEAPPTPEAGWSSRGQLVTSLASVSNLAEAEEKVDALDHASYPPFRLLGFFPESKKLEVAAWLGNGQNEIERIPASAPMSSSSFETKVVLSQRAATYQTMSAPIGIDQLHDFHHSVGEPNTAYTVRMNRPDAQTWSISRLSVDPDSVRFQYEAESLDLASPPTISESQLIRK